MVKMNNNELNKLYCYQAIVDVLTTCAEMELGESVELNINTIFDYMNSTKWIADQFDCNSIEHFYKIFTNDILNGCPVWRFFKLSDWQVKMLEITFANDIEEMENEQKKKYKCLTCKNYNVINTQLGTIYKCKIKQDGRGILRQFKTRCKNYISIDV